MMPERLDDELAFLMKLTEFGIPPDVQELLVRGDPTCGIRPGALSAAIRVSQIRESALKKAGDLLCRFVVGIAEYSGCEETRHFAKGALREYRFALMPETPVEKETP